MTSHPQELPPLRFGVTRVCFCAGISAKQHIWPRDFLVLVTFDLFARNKKTHPEKTRSPARIGDNLCESTTKRVGLFLLCCKSAAKVNMQRKISSHFDEMFLYGP